MSWKDRARAALRKQQGFSAGELTDLQQEAAQSNTAIPFLIDSFLGGMQTDRPLDYSIDSLSLVEDALRSVAVKHGVRHEWTEIFIRQASLYLGEVIRRLSGGEWGYAPSASSAVQAIVVKSRSGNVSANPFNICSQVAATPSSQIEGSTTMASFVTSILADFEGRQ